jgi:hypothetical protein
MMLNFFSLGLQIITSTNDSIEKIYDRLGPMWTKVGSAPRLEEGA